MCTIGRGFGPKALKIFGLREGRLRFETKADDVELGHPNSLLYARGSYGNASKYAIDALHRPPKVIGQ
jgi:hypothetical protein